MNTYTYTHRKYTYWQSSELLNRSTSNLPRPKKPSVYSYQCLLPAQTDRPCLNEPLAKPTPGPPVTRTRALSLGGGVEGSGWGLGWGRGGIDSWGELFSVFIQMSFSWYFHGFWCFLSFQTVFIFFNAMVWYNTCFKCFACVFVVEFFC